MKHLLFHTCLFIAFNSCIEAIDFETETPVENIVVEGNITNQPGPYTVKLSTPSPYGKQQFFPLGEAAITLFENDKFLGTFVETEAGIYTLDEPEVQGEVGKSYSIEIVLPSGKIYRSQPERLPTPVRVDSLAFSIESQAFLNQYGLEQVKQFAKIESVFTIPNSEESVFLRWESESSFLFIDVLARPPGVPKACYIKDLPNPQRIELFDGQRFDSGTSFRQEVAVQDADFSFNWARGYLVRQFSITQNAHTYRANLQKIANVEGTIFDPPPAAVKGNVFNVNDSEELVQGYFEAAALEQAGYVATSAEVKPFFNIPYPCGGNRPQGVPPSACFSCLAFPNSSTTRPDYW